MNINKNEKVYGLKEVEEAARFLEARLKKSPQIGLILGSGLGVLAESVEDAVKVPYAQIPHFPVSTVAGHAGEWISGELAGRQVVMMNGRFHLYEGYPPAAAALGVRVMHMLGVRTLIVTNAAGGINENFAAGDLMLITDHLNMMFRNPLIGPNEERFGPRFPDMSEAYSIGLRKRLKKVANELGIELREGVYAGVLGPSYETPAEVRMLRILGADAVGMSTVPEVIAARHAGIEVLGISCISNLAAGIANEPLSHDEVVATAEAVKEKFIQLIIHFLKGMEEK